VTDTAVALDTVSSLALVLSNVADSVQIFDTPSSVRSLPGLITESSLAIDNIGTQVQNLASVLEGVAVIDALIANYLWNSVIDTQNANWQAVPATQVPGWASVADSQNQNWQAVPATQGPGWTPAVDAQNPNWQTTSA
jgi:hypothetical protein